MFNAVNEKATLKVNSHLRYHSSESAWSRKNEVCVGVEKTNTREALMAPGLEHIEFYIKCARRETVWPKRRKGDCRAELLLQDCRVAAIWQHVGRSSRLRYTSKHGRCQGMLLQSLMSTGTLQA